MNWARLVRLLVIEVLSLGFHPDGSRDPAQWNGEVLTRAAKSAWLALIAKHALPLPDCRDARPPPFHL